MPPKASSEPEGAGEDEMISEEEEEEEEKEPVVDEITLEVEGVDEEVVGETVDVVRVAGEFDEVAEELEDVLEDVFEDCMVAMPPAKGHAPPAAISRRLMAIFGGMLRGCNDQSFGVGIVMPLMGYLARSKSLAG